MVSVVINKTSKQQPKELTAQSTAISEKISHTLNEEISHLLWNKVAFTMFRWTHE